MLSFTHHQILELVNELHKRDHLLLRLIVLYQNGSPTIYAHVDVNFFSSFYKGIRPVESSSNAGGLTLFNNGCQRVMLELSRSTLRASLPAAGIVNVHTSSTNSSVMLES
jgi:hypothetical protein